jgi:hypothetical protein
MAMLQKVITVADKGHKRAQMQCLLALGRVKEC